MHTSNSVRSLVLTLALGGLIGRANPATVPAPASPPEIVVVVSGFSPAARLEAARHLITRMLLQDAPMGTRLAVWDGFRLDRVVDTEVPVLAYDNIEARAVQVAPALVSLGRWVAQRRAAPRDPEFSDTDAIRLPELIAELPEVRSASGRRVLILSSPFYLSPGEPSFSMCDGRYPSDAHLDAPLAKTPFGVSGRARALQGTTIYWSCGPESEWLNGAHKLAVRRWWSLWLSAMQAKLAYFGNDTPVATSWLFAGQTQTSADARRDPADTKIEMRSARPRTVPDWLVTTPLPQHQPASEQASIAPVAPPPAQEPETASVPAAPANPPIGPTAPVPVVNGTSAPPAPMPAKFDPSKTGIGIAWSEPVDLDLYVRLKPGVKELYYNRDRTPEGFLYRDERQANAGRQFEFIEFRARGPVDLSQATVWINYYAGHAKGVTGQIAVFEQGRVRVGRFTLPSSRGNAGGDSGRRATSPYWVEIRLSGLEESRAPLVASKPGNG